MPLSALLYARLTCHGPKTLVLANSASGITVGTSSHTDVRQYRKVGVRSRCEWWGASARKGQLLSRQTTVIPSKILVSVNKQAEGVNNNNVKSNFKNTASFHARKAPTIHRLPLHVLCRQTNGKAKEKNNQQPLSLI